jgi:hypothetical protein
MKKTRFVLLAFYVVVFGSGCGQYCERARNEVLEPIQKTTAYLQSNPSGETLLDNVKGLPAGAEVIRRLADSKFAHSYSKCVTWAKSSRFYCYPQPYPQKPICYSEPYEYCAKWEHDVIYDPGFTMALDLSQDLDGLYERTHHMCGQAAAGNYENAYSESRDILNYVISEVKPGGDRVYALACTNGAAPTH